MTPQGAGRPFGLGESIEALRACHLRGSVCMAPGKGGEEALVDFVEADESLRVPRRAKPTNAEWGERSPPQRVTLHDRPCGAPQYRCRGARGGRSEGGQRVLRLGMSRYREDRNWEEMPAALVGLDAALTRQLTQGGGCRTNRGLLGAPIYSRSGVRGFVRQDPPEPVIREAIRRAAFDFAQRGRAPPISSPQHRPLDRA